MKVFRGQACLALAALVWLGAQRSTGMAAQTRAELPAGEGRDAIEEFCSDCHGTERISGMRRTRAEWQYLVDDMASRNGVATDADVKAIVGYIVKHFGRANVNAAPEAELVEAVDLTADEAKAIVEFRTRAGKFGAIEDLRKVPGIDFGRIQERKDRIVFTGA